MPRKDDWYSYSQDGRTAPFGKPQVTQAGKFWVLRVNLFQPDWPADCVTRLLIWEDAITEELSTSTGKYWPLKDEDEDDAA